MSWQSISGSNLVPMHALFNVKLISATQANPLTSPHTMCNERHALLPCCED